MTVLRANDSNNLIASSITSSSGNSFAFTPLNNITVLALAGNDTISVSDGALLSQAVIRAAEGNDSVNLGTSGAVNASLFGGAGNDSITLAGSLVNGVLQSLSGNNHFSVQAATLVSLQSGTGNDTLLINGLATISTIRSGAGDDTLWLAAGSDNSWIFSGDGNDTITAANASTLTATQVQDLSGNNRFSLGALNASTLIGGSGNDTLLLNGISTGSLVRLAAGNDSLVLGAQATASSLFTGAGDDTIRLDAAAANTQVISHTGRNRYLISDAALASTNLLIDSNAESSLWLANDNLNLAEAFFGANNLSGGINTVTNLEAGGAGAQVLLGNAAYARGIRQFVAQEGLNARVQFEPTPSSAAITVIGASGDDSIRAGNGSDSISGGAGNDSITSRDGDDTISAGDGNDIAYANIGNDLLWAGSGNDELDGGQGNDTIWGGSGNDTINGGSTGVDLLYGEDGDDMVRFDDGVNELFTAGALVDQIDGGAGSNSIRLSFAAAGYAIAVTDNWSRASNIQTLETGFAYGNAITFDLNASAFTTGIRTVSLARDTNPAGANRVDASLAIAGQNLSLVGSSGADAITGGAGNDTITGGDGADLINPGAGTNSIQAGRALDQITINTASTNTIDLMLGGAGNLTTITVGGTAGERTTTVQARTANANMQATVVGTVGVIMTAAESGPGASVQFTGGDGSDSILGSTGQDVLVGGAGNDTITGAAEYDDITLGAGADIVVFGGSGNLGTVTGTAAQVAANLGAFGDAINDYNVAEDSIQLSQASFGAVATGPLGALDAAKFVSVALTTTSVNIDFTTGGFVYVQGAGQLWYTTANMTIAATDTINKTRGASSVMVGDFAARPVIGVGELAVIA